MNGGLSGRLGVASDAYGDLDRASDDMFRDFLEIPLEVCVDPVGFKLGTGFNRQVVLFELESGLSEPHGVPAKAQSLAEEIRDRFSGVF
tara:strand:- start:549 stop:815 length:267 start_codon:yes stop_codon:yes gene_type:complete